MFNAVFLAAGEVTGEADDRKQGDVSTLLNPEIVGELVRGRV